MVEIRNTSAKVLWDAVEESKRNSEISGYILQYTSSDTKVTNSKSVNSPTTFEVKNKVRAQHFYDITKLCIFVVIRLNNFVFNPEKKQRSTSKV